MGLRDRLASPLLTVSLAGLALALVAGVALVTGLVSIPRINLDFFAYSTFAPAAGPTPSPAPSPTLAEQTFAYPTPSPQPTFTSYTVKPHDTLTSIAKAYGTTGRSIAWWNRGTYPSLDPESPSYRPDDIKEGWVLVLLPGQVVDDNNPPTPSPGPETPVPSDTVAPASS
ncbi:MAG TPA: LysM domain-containing protein [Candidatus Limnocylindrales bacterium]